VDHAHRDIGRITYNVGPAEGFSRSERFLLPGEEAASVAQADRMCAAGSVQLVEDVGDVRGCRLGADQQSFADLPVGKTQADELEDLQFAGGQMIPTRIAFAHQAHASIRCRDRCIPRVTARSVLLAR
jgi:hypothetical protein